ncbi:MAG: hypothetical protein WD847_12645 [Pirellulales bacterium]
MAKAKQDPKVMTESLLHFRQVAGLGSALRRRQSVQVSRQELQDRRAELAT